MYSIVLPEGLEWTGSLSFSRIGFFFFFFFPPPPFPSSHFKSWTLNWIQLLKNKTRCDSYYKEPLTPQQKEERIYKDFILKYELNMSNYVPSDYMAYDTVNEFFVRPLRPGSRPISSPMDERVFTSPADARVLVLPEIPKVCILHLLSSSSFLSSSLNRLA